ncbi:hypothetical protein [Pseudonocardia sp.]|uniref:hypothetical protein n=1 Tax=Pseudonocardia sp. TaxID=60912 RepID=UPI003D148D7F
MTSPVTTSRAARVLLAAAAALLLAGCGATGSTGSTGNTDSTGTGTAGSTADTTTSSSSATNCDLSGCTITFQRRGDGTVSVFGVNARLVSVDEGSARIEVAGRTIVVPVGSTTQAEGFTVGVERVTDTEVVVRVTR